MKLQQRLLIVDEDASVRERLGLVAERRGLVVSAAEAAAEALELAERERPELIALDVSCGFELLDRLRELVPTAALVALAPSPDASTIVEAMRHGAGDFVRKPFEPAELEAVLEKALQRRLAVGDAMRACDPRGPHAAVLPVLGTRMQKISAMIEQIADTDVTVLLRGESGTGKELVARALYARSRRARRPFVKVNCAALPSELLESELFGYERGAFTGAEKRKLGRFELASGGTIFLDEISEMHPSLQAKLLQVLQDGQFSRLGGHTDIVVDARVIAASNRDLEAAVRDGSFREDLFYRLNVVVLHLPPLRERRDEIAALTDCFVARYAREFRKPEPELSAAARAAFAAYDWPGNVRELENLVKRLVVLENESAVLIELRAPRPPVKLLAASAGARAQLPDATTELARFLAGQSPRVSLKRIAREASAEAERQVIARVLERTRWNRKEAAEILQISYKALLYKMRDAGLVQAS